MYSAWRVGETHSFCKGHTSACVSFKASIRDPSKPTYLLIGPAMLETATLFEKNGDDQYFSLQNMALRGE
jgi:hypothetical protein